MPTVDDINSPEMQRAEAVQAGDMLPGDTYAIRKERFERARTVAKILTVVALVLTAGCVFTQVPNIIIILPAAIMPWLLLLLIDRSRGLYWIFPYMFARNNTAPFFGTPNLEIAFLLSGFAMSACTPRFIHVIWWHGILVGIFIFVLSMMMVARCILRDPFGLIIVLIASAFYGYGVTMTANWYLDLEPAKMFRVAVLEKSSDHPVLKLAAWGPIINDYNISVAPWQYESANKGSEICTLLHSGALDIPWYSFTSCSTN